MRRGRADQLGTVGRARNGAAAVAGGKHQDRSTPVRTTRQAYPETARVRIAQAKSKIKANQLAGSSASRLRRRRTRGLPVREIAGHGFETAPSAAKGDVPVRPDQVLSTVRCGAHAQAIERFACDVDEHVGPLPSRARRRTARRPSNRSASLLMDAASQASARPHRRS